jgi:hypothetical protein
LFRSIREISPHHDDQDRCVVGIGVDLGIRRAETLCLQNLVSLVAADAKRAELDDRDQLVQMLMRQFRRRISERIDLGTIALSSLFQNFRRFTHWWVQRHMRRGYSCWYGCFDLPAPVNDLFCDVEVHEVRYFGPAWSPPGFTLLVNTWQERLLFQASYVPETVPDAVAETLLERFFTDLKVLIDEV